MPTEFEDYSEDDIQFRESTPEDYGTALQQLRDFAGQDISQVATVEQLAEVSKGVGPALFSVMLAHGHFREGETRPLESDPKAMQFMKKLHMNAAEHSDTPLDEVTKGTIYQLPQYEFGGVIEDTTPVRNVSLTAHASHGQEYVDIAVSPRISVSGLNIKERRRAHQEWLQQRYGVTLFADRPLRATGKAVRQEGEISWSDVDWRIHAYDGRLGDKNYRPLAKPPLVDPTDVQEAPRVYARVLQTSVKDVLSLNLPSPTPIPAGIMKQFNG